MPEPTERDFELAQALLSLIDRQSDDGSYVFTDEDVRHFLPLMLLQLSGSIDASSLAPETQELLGSFAVAAGIEKGTPPQEAAAKVNAFYEKNPPNEELLKAFQRFVNDAIAEHGAGEGVSKAVSQLLGQQSSNKPVGSGEPPPQGSVRGGLLARLGASDALDKKKKDDEG